MKKRNFIKSLVIAAAVTCMLLIYSQAMAAGECPPIGTNTCWNFDSGYQIQVIDQGVLDPETGLEKWSYLVIKTKKADANQMLLGLEKDLVVVDHNASQLHEPCVGGPNENIVSGDCLRQYLEWNYNLEETVIYFYVQPAGKSMTLPVFVTGASQAEAGTIIGPAFDTALIVETTFTIKKTDDGRALAIKMDRNHNILSVETCKQNLTLTPPVTCDDYPEDFTYINPDDPTDTGGVDLIETVFCVPADPPDIPVNETLDDGTEMHCGNILFIDEGASAKITEKLTIYYINGRAYYVRD